MIRLSIKTNWRVLDPPISIFLNFKWGSNLKTVPRFFFGSTPCLVGYFGYSNTNYHKLKDNTGQIYLCVCWCQKLNRVKAQLLNPAPFATTLAHRFSLLSHCGKGSLKLSDPPQDGKTDGHCITWASWISTSQSHLCPIWLYRYHILLLTFCQKFFCKLANIDSFSPVSCMLFACLLNILQKSNNHVERWRGGSYGLCHNIYQLNLAKRGLVRTSIH